MKRIAIVGVGFVGSSLYDLLSRKYKVMRYDPAKKFSCSKEQVNDSDVVFLCLPTPLDWKSKNYNYSAIKESLKWINKNILVAIKSTVEPGFCRKAATRFGHKIVFNPEFLRQKYAKEDMLGADRVILGGKRNDCLKVKAIYEQVYPAKVKYYLTSFEEAELTKLATNAYLAGKVSFCNEIKEFCTCLGINYNKLREVWLSDERIGESHTKVTKEGGFAGSCFPKDLNALIYAMQRAKIEPIMQKAAWRANLKHREDLAK